RGDDLLPGYGWVFPLADGTVNVGVGLLNTSAHFRNISYRQLLKEWVPTVGPEWGFGAGDAAAKPRSHPLPMGANRHPPVKGGGHRLPPRVGGAGRPGRPGDAGVGRPGPPARLPGRGRAALRQLLR